MIKVNLVSLSGRRLLTNCDSIRCQTVLNRKSLFSLVSSDCRKVYKEQKVVNFTKEQLFSLVSKTDEYYKFLPACHKSKTKSRQENKAYVELEVGFAPLLERYTSEVTFKRPNSVVAVSQNGRLFNNLISKWEFHDLPANGGAQPDKCLIKFEVEFEFKSKVLMRLGMPFFEITAKNTLDAFIKRANQLYKS